MKISKDFWKEQYSGHFPCRSRWRVWRLWRLRVVNAAFHSGSGGYVTWKLAISIKFSETVLLRCMLLKTETEEFPALSNQSERFGSRKLSWHRKHSICHQVTIWRKTLVQVVNTSEKTELRTRTVGWPQSIGSFASSRNLTTPRARVCDNPEKRLRTRLTVSMFLRIL